MYMHFNKIINAINNPLFYNKLSTCCSVGIFILLYFNE